MKTAKKRNPVLGLPEGAWFYEPLPGFPSDPGSQFRFFKEAKNEAEAVRQAKGMIRALGPEVVVERPTTPGGPFRLHYGEAVGARGLFDMERSWFPHVSNLNPIYKEGNPGYHRRRNPDDLKPLSGSSAKQIKYGEDMRRQLLPRIDAAVEQTPELSEAAKLMRAMPTARFWIDLAQPGADVVHSLLNTDLGEQSIIMRYYAKPAEISTRRGMTKVGGTRPYLRKYFFTGRAENLGVDKGEVAAKKRRQEERAKESARSSPAAIRARRRQREKEEQEAEDAYERAYRESGQLDRDIDEWKIGRYDPDSQHYEEERAASAGYPMGKP